MTEILMLYTLLIVYISLYYIRPFEWVEAFQDIPLFYTLGLMACVCIAVRFFHRIATSQVNMTDIMLVGFSFSIITSHLSHGYFGGALISINNFIPSFTSYFLTFYALTSRSKINYFIALITLLSCFLSYESVLQSMTGMSDGGLSPLYEYFTNPEADNEQIIITRTRWFGIFNDPNDLGMALIIPIPFLIDKLLTKKNLFTIIPLFSIMCGVIATNSRGTMLALAISATSYFSFRYRSMKSLCFGLFLGGIAIVFGPSRMSTFQDASTYGRVESWYAGLQMFLSNPVFGVGAGSYCDHWPLTAHNSFLLVLSELGFVGSFFFVGFFYYPLHIAISVLFKNSGRIILNDDSSMLSACLACVFGTLTTMFFLSRSYVFQPFIVIGILLSYINIILGSTSKGYRDILNYKSLVRILFGVLFFEIISLYFITKILI